MKRLAGVLAIVAACRAPSSADAPDAAASPQASAIPAAFTSGARGGAGGASVRSTAESV